MPRRAALAALVMVLAAWPAAAQVGAAASRPGPYVFDVRGVFVGAPTGAGFFPPVPSGTIAPTREFGFDVGGHVYLFQWRAARIGLGADLFRLHGSASTKIGGDDEDDDRNAAPVAQDEAEFPDIDASVTTIAPQISLNFGSAAGWSYVGAGYGRAQLTGTRSVFDDGDEDTMESGGVSSLNFGGGARWFTSDHLAVGFDVRFHMISAGNTPRTTLVSVAAGLSLR
jgi:hypothetical protein